MYPNSQQQSCLPIADELWLLSHSETSGRPRLADDHIAIGLAGAVLCELLISRALVLSEHHSHVMINFNQAYDELGVWVLEQVARSRASAPPEQWIPYLADEVEPKVAERLAGAGAVDWEKAGMFGRGRRAVPRNVNIAAGPRVRLLHQMASEDWDINTATVGAISVAIDLDVTIAADAAQDKDVIRSALVAVGRRLPAPLKTVGNAIRATIVDVTMTIRR